MKLKFFVRQFPAVMLMLLLLSCATASFTSCTKKVGPTSILVLDSIRHYYSILQGQEINMIWRIANVGKTPLVLTDIQPSCGCISTDEDNNIILPGEEGKLHFVFHSTKNTGYVRHTIRLFGNIMPTGQASLIFDVHVVPPYNASPAYEDIYNAWLEKHPEKKNVDGTNNQRGYWTLDGKYSRSHKRYPWKEERAGNRDF